MRVAAALSLSLLLISCGSSNPPSSAPVGAKKPAKVKITQFYAPSGKVPAGMKGTLCYGVENATRVELNPRVEELWPSSARCFEIAPSKPTTYTLTAFGEDGSTAKESLDVKMTAAPPKIYDLSVNKIEVSRGEEVTVCFKTQNAKSVKVSAGRLNKSLNCIFDHPTKTTSYRITAIGGDREIDNGVVTVRVH